MKILYNNNIKIIGLTSLVLCLPISARADIEGKFQLTHDQRRMTYSISCDKEDGFPNPYLNITVFKYCYLHSRGYIPGQSHAIESNSIIVKNFCEEKSTTLDPSIYLYNCTYSKARSLKVTIELSNPTTDSYGCGYFSGTCTR